MLLLTWALAPFVTADRSTGGPGSLAPDRHWDLEHLHLDLEIHPEDARIEGSVTLSLEPLTPPATKVVLDQVDLEIQAVLVDDAPTEFFVYEGRLEAVVPPRAHELTVRYAATPLSGLHFRGTGPDTYTEVWSQGEGEDNRFWIPLPDYPNDRFTSSGRFVVPKGYKVLSNGLGEFDGTAWNYTMEQDLVSYLVMLAAGPYKIQRETWRGRPVEQWLPPDTTDAQADSVRGVLPEMLDFFSERTGLDYPYPTYREVYVQRFLYSGMENTTSTVMARRVLLHEEHLQTRLDGTRSIQAHELAHQWYGDALTCRTWHELWLNEGFATFMQGEWLRHAEGEEAWALHVSRRYRWSLDSGPLAGRWWSTPDGSHEESGSVYSKGASVLRMLQVMLGEEAFWEGIQLYTKRHAHGLVETDDLRRAMEEVSGMHLRWFFDQWVHLGGAPELEASWSHDDGALRVTLLRSEQPWIFPVEIQAGEVTRTVWVDQDKVVLVIPMEDPPAYVAVDPRGGLLAKIKTKQSVPMWIAQAEGSSHAYAKLTAIDALGSDGSEEAARWLLTLAEDASAPLALRLRALDALDRSPWDFVAEGVSELLKDPHDQLRRDAARTLGRSPSKQARPLAEAWRRERNPDVRAALLRHWAQHDRDAALREAESFLRLRRPKTGPNPVHIAALDLIGEEGGPEHLDLVLQQVRLDRPHDVAHPAMWAAGRLVRRFQPGIQRERAAEQAARRIEALLQSAYLRTRTTAASVLGQVGDERSIVALQAYRKWETVEWSADRAKDSVSAIRKRDDSAPEPEDGELEERLLALEEEQQALRDRLDTLDERR